MGDGNKYWREGLKSRGRAVKKEKKTERKMKIKMSKKKKKRRIRAVGAYWEAEEQGHRLGKDPALAIGSMILL